MGFSLFLGCLLISNGTNFALLMPVAQRAHLLIVMVFSSFFWWLSMIVISAVTAIIPALRDHFWILVPLSVITQEAFRLLYFNCFAIICRNLKRRTPSVDFSVAEQLSIAVASGLGIAICHSMTFHVTTLVETASGPGTFFTPNCPGISMFVVSAASSGAFSVIHVALMVLAFDAFGQRSVVKGVLVVGVHMGASLLTMLNTTGGNAGCYATMSALPALAVVLAAGTLKFSRGAVANRTCLIDKFMDRSD